MSSTPRTTTPRRRLAAVGAGLGAALVAAPAAAGTISGTITAQAGGAPIASAEVRVWTEGPKGWRIHQTTTASGSGTYTFTLPAGDYLVDARGPVNSGSNYGDRWYDVAAPTSGGYVGEDADVIALGASDAVAGVNLALEVLGGADGTVVRPGGAAAPSMWVRMERRGEVRIHHNDFTKALPAGLVSMRGMVPASDYQVIIYDPTGVLDTRLLAGPFSIAAGAVGALGTLAMVNAPADPYEGNNAPSCGAASIDIAGLRANPSQPWTSTGARIGPLSAGDVDWYCFPAVDGDRLFVTATTQFTFNGATRRHPWTDPLLSFWRGARVERLAEDDDSGGGYDAMLDTGPLAAGCHCAAVTTFGDASFLGTGQTSTGAYQLRVAMGNRPPVPSVRKGATEVPAAPSIFTVDEGDTLVLTLAYPDADGDLPTKAFSHVSGGDPITDGTLTLGDTGGTYTWQVPPDAADRNPYTLRLEAGDAEFTMSKTVLLVVNAVDMPPAVPDLVSPIDGAVVATGAPTLTWAAAVDPDGDAVTYDLELYEDDPAGAPAQTATGVAATTWVPTTIAENTRVWWRVRARGAPGAMSPWSAYGRFLVDAANDAPETPILIKPSEGELLAIRRPGLSVLNVTDPEDEDVDIVFEIARDDAFASVVWTSAPVPQNPVSATTMTSSDVDLSWGADYYARARAVDARGAESGWSEVHKFRLKPNVPPGAPAFDGGCVATTYDDEPPAAIVVENVLDPEGEVVTFELELFRFDDDPATANPVYATSARMSAEAPVTAIPVDLSGLDNGRYRYVVVAFDGTDHSDPIECELTLELPDLAGQPGGCCGAGADPMGALALTVLAGGGVVGLGRRRRRAMAPDRAAAPDRS